MCMYANSVNVFAFLHLYMQHRETHTESETCPLCALRLAQT